MKKNDKIFEKEMLVRPKDVELVANLDDFDFNEIDFASMFQHIQVAKEQALTEYARLKQEIDMALKDQKKAKEIEFQFANRGLTAKPSDIQNIDMRAVAVVSIMSNRIAWNLSEHNPEDKVSIELHSLIYTHANIIITESASESDRQTYYHLKG